MLWNDVPKALEKPAGKRWQQRTDVPGAGWKFGQGVWWAQVDSPRWGDAVP